MSGCGQCAPSGDVIVVDTEFSTPPGERPVPICAVAKNLDQGDETRVWLWGRKVDAPPFPTDAIFVCYSAPAEMGIQESMGWTLPENVIDLYAEYRVKTNGHPHKPQYSGLIDACTFHGIPTSTSEHKELMQNRCIVGGPFSDEDRETILQYCSEDVEMTSRLFVAMKDEIDWPRALVRGMFGKAVAAIEGRGIPIDIKEYSRIRKHWERLKDAVLLDINRQFPVFEDGIFKDALFEKVVQAKGYDWPRTPTGRLSRTKETFDDVVKIYPEVRDLADGVAMLGQMRLGSIEIGMDDRNRASLRAFATKTGRCAPKTNLIWGHSVWYRSLISPREGMALSYLDYKSEEFAISAYLSGDREMIDAYRSGDPYMSFAIKAGLAPEGATKATYKDVRDRCKTVVLGLSYGMGDKTLAKRLEIPPGEARHLLHSYQDVFHQYHEWAREAVQQALLTGSQQTSYGWFHHCGGGRTDLRTIQNWPIQSTGSDILRMACIMLEKEGIRVISTIHDAVLIEDTIDDIDSTVERAAKQMELASSYVLRGAGSIQVEAKTIKSPNHYSDDRGDRMWERVQRILKELEASTR